MSDGPALLRTRGGNLSPNPKFTLRRLVAPTLTIAALLMVAVLPSIMAAGGEPDAKVLRPDADDVPGGAGADEQLLYEADPTPNVVDHEPNNGCTGAYPWPPRSTGLTKGKLGTTDAEDWSRVELYRTESLVASTPKGVVTLESAENCGEALFLGGAVADVTDNGWVPLRVSASDTFEGYHLEYQIKANDASTGADLPDDPSGAFTINALPESMNPREVDLKTGSVSYRLDALGPDKDWFRVNTGLAQAPDTQNVDTDDLNLGLLTVYFNSDCYTGQRGFTLFQADSATPITDTVWGCGPMLASCIAASFSAVYAKLEEDHDSGGAGYDFFAAISPLSVVSLEGGVETTVLDPLQPWCDPLTPLALAAAAGTSGEPWGVMDKHGRIVAKVNNGSP